MSEPIMLEKGGITLTIVAPSQVNGLLADGWQRTGDESSELEHELELQEPFEGYDKMTAAALVARVDELTPEEREYVSQYEAANKARKTVLEAIVE